MRNLLRRFKNFLWSPPPKPVETPQMTLGGLRRQHLDESVYTYLIDRANDRDQLFKKIEQAVRDRNYTLAIHLAEKGWQLSGR